MLLLIFAKLCLPLVQKVWVWWWIPNYQRKLEITPICQICNFELQELVMLDDGWMPAPQNYLFLSTCSRLDYSNSLLASCLDSCSHEFPHTQKSKCRCGINFQSATLPVNNSTIKSASLASCLMKSLLQKWQISATRWSWVWRLLTKLLQCTSLSGHLPPATRHLHQQQQEPLSRWPHLLFLSASDVSSILRLSHLPHRHFLSLLLLLFTTLYSFKNLSLFTSIETIRGLHNGNKK